MRLKFLQLKISWSWKKIKILSNKVSLMQKKQNPFHYELLNFKSLPINNTHKYCRVYIIRLHISYHKVLYHIQRASLVVMARLEMRSLLVLFLSLISINTILAQKKRKPIVTSLNAKWSNTPILLEVRSISHTPRFHLFLLILS